MVDNPRANQTAKPLKEGKQTKINKIINLKHCIKRKIQKKKNTGSGTVEFKY
jgi:hypothetical protein